MKKNGQQEPELQRSNRRKQRREPQKCVNSRQFRARENGFAEEACLVLGKTREKKENIKGGFTFLEGI